jgi:hypothetical protein
VDQLSTVSEEDKSVSIAKAQEIHQVLSILAQFVVELEKLYEKLKLRIQSKKSQCNATNAQVAGMQANKNALFVADRKLF